MFIFVQLTNQLLFETNFQKVDQYTIGKRLIHGTKFTWARVAVLDNYPKYIRVSPYILKVIVPIMRSNSNIYMFTWRLVM